MPNQMPNQMPSQMPMGAQPNQMMGMANMGSPNTSPPLSPVSSSGLDEFGLGSPAQLPPRA
jgi:hypothetical protein